MPKLTLGQFIGVFSKSAEEQGVRSVVDGLKKYRSKYSFAGDDGIECSLDIVWITLGVETLLENDHGFVNCTFVDELVVEGGTMREIYANFCREAAIQPDFSELLAA